MQGLSAIILMLFSFAAKAQVYTGATESIRGEHVQVQILSSELSLRPGQAQSFGLRFQPDPRWHVYWRNPGDSGEAPRLEWKKPEGWSVSEFTWPLPARIPVGPFYNIGYEGEVILPFTIKLPPELPADRVEMEALVKWLVCEEECIPGQHLFRWSMPIQQNGPGQRAVWADVLDQARTLGPQGSLPVEPEPSQDEKTVQIRIEKSALLEEGKLVDFFPYEGTGMKSAPPELSDLGIVLQRSSEKATRPLGGVAVFTQADGKKIAYHTELGRAPAPPAGEGLWALLVLAFFGGLILNFMPCVLPVLAIKVLGLVRESGEDKRKVRLGSLVYGAGVLLSFFALAGILLLFKAGGEAVGWGFQLQSPVFIAALALLFFVMALNFLDLIQPWNAFTLLAQLGSRREGPGAQFLSGVLAVIVASPCTGPFMGVAVGSALARTPFESLLIFGGIGLGFSSPFVALAWVPRSRRFLPRPGAWMETFRQAMAFPLLLTILWLLWVIEKQSGMEGVLWLLGAFIGLGFCAWFWQQYKEKTLRRAWGLGLLMLLTGGLAMYQQREALESAATAKQDSSDADWEAFSRERLATARKEGPVFVDFTAAWCVTCQVNKTLVLNRDDVQSAFKERGIRLMRADWTAYDPEITRTLESLGRRGVPVYALYSGAASEPLLLPELLTPELIMDAIRRVNSNPEEE